MSILSKEGILDASAMAYRLLLWEESRFGIIADIGLVDGPSTARQYGSVMFRNLGQVNTADPGSEAVAREAGGLKNLTMELPLSDMVSSQLMTAMDSARVGGGRQAVGLGRWCYHLKTIRGMEMGRV